MTQLDLFSLGREPQADPPTDSVVALDPESPVSPATAVTAEPASRPRTQLTELPGTEFEDIFTRKDAA